MRERKSYWRERCLRAAQRASSLLGLSGWAPTLIRFILAIVAIGALLLLGSSDAGKDEMTVRFALVAAIAVLWPLLFALQFFVSVPKHMHDELVAELCGFQKIESALPAPKFSIEKDNGRAFLRIENKNRDAYFQAKILFHDSLGPSLPKSPVFAEWYGEEGDEGRFIQDHSFDKILLYSTSSNVGKAKGWLTFRWVSAGETRKSNSSRWDITPDEDVVPRVSGEIKVYLSSTPEMAGGTKVFIIAIDSSGAQINQDEPETNP